MPDRDDFNALHPRHKPAAREFIRIAQGAEPDLLKIAESINLRVQGGVASLDMTLQHLARQGGLFQGQEFKRHQLRELEELHERHGFLHANDKLLRREAARACVRGDFDKHVLVRQFVWSLLKADIIEAKHGVRDQLHKRNLPLDMARLETTVSPLLDTAAALMLRRPNFKRLGLASGTPKPVDLHNTNLLGGLA